MSKLNKNVNQNIKGIYLESRMIHLNVQIPKTSRKITFKKNG